MLKPDYFDDKAEIIDDYYRKLEDWILEDIADRLLESEHVAGTTDWQLWKLEQLGLHQAEIRKKLTELTGYSEEELQALLKDAVLTSWKDDSKTFEKMGKTIANPLSSQAYLNVIDAEYKKAKRDLQNLTQTTLNQSQADLINLLNEAEMKVAMGSQSYSGAVCEVLDNYAKKGVTIVEYESGQTRTVESAVNTIIRTSMNQTSGQLTNKYIADEGVEYVLISAHTGARYDKKHPEGPSCHSYWQGKIYKINGSSEGYPNLTEATGYRIHPDGTGECVNMAGLHGYNCRHSHQPWSPELGNPWNDENGQPKVEKAEEEYKQAKMDRINSDDSLTEDEKAEKLKHITTKYEDEQKQRAMERSIRSTKRQLLVKDKEIKEASSIESEGLQSEYDVLAYKLRQKNEAYNEFSKENGLPKQSERLKVMKFNRKQASKANGRATVVENEKNANS